MSESKTVTKYEEVILPDAAEMESFAEYGFESYQEKADKSMHISVSEKAYQDIEKIRKELGETQGSFCGRILTAATEKSYKPISTSVQENFKIKMAKEKQVTAYLRKSDLDKIEELAKSMKMKKHDYARFCIYSALKGWKQN